MPPPGRAAESARVINITGGISAGPHRPGQPSGREVLRRPVVLPPDQVGADGCRSRGLAMPCCDAPHDRLTA